MYLYLNVCTVYAMFALYNCCGQKLLYADFANKMKNIPLTFTLVLCEQYRINGPPGYNWMLIDITSLLIPLQHKMFYKNVYFV